jgi:hypothetical protein
LGALVVTRTQVLTVTRMSAVEGIANVRALGVHL